MRISKKIIGSGLVIVLTIVGFEIFRAYRSAEDSLSKERARLLEHSRVAFTKTRLTSFQSNDVRIWQNFSDARAFAEYKNSYFAATSGGLVQRSLSGGIVRHYTVLDGLPESDLTALAVFGDKLFIGTRSKGLVEFDGETFTQYEWTDRRAQTVAALLSAGDNRLLIGTFGGGLLEFDGANFSEIKADAQTIKAINFLSKIGDQLCVGTFDNGLWIYEKDRWTHFTAAEGLSSNRVVGVAPHAGKLLVATDFGLSISEANRFRTIEILPALSGLIRFGERTFLTRDNGEIFTFDRSLNEFAKKNNLTGARLTTANGKLFLLGSAGVFSFDDHKFSPFGDASNRINDNFISALTIDGRGNLWAGTFRRGIDVLTADGRLLTHLETEGIREINFLQTTDETVVAATTQGIFRIKPDLSHTVFDRSNGLPSNAVTHTSGDVTATARGLVFGSGGKNPKVVSSVNRLPNNSVYTTLVVGATVYAGTLSGLAQIENQRVVRTWQDSNSNLATNWVTALVLAHERIFVGTYGGGIFELLPSGEIRSFAGEIGKFVVNPNALASDEKRLYVGTLDGVKILNLQTQKWTNLKKVLPSETVMNAAVGEEIVYFGTSSGIAAVGKSYFENAEKTDENF